MQIFVSTLLQCLCSSTVLALAPLRLPNNTSIPAGQIATNTNTTVTPEEYNAVLLAKIEAARTEFPDDFEMYRIETGFWDPRATEASDIRWLDLRFFTTYNRHSMYLGPHTMFEVTSSQYRGGWKKQSDDYSEVYWYYEPERDRRLDYDPDTMLTPMEIMASLRRAGCHGFLSSLQLLWFRYPAATKPIIFSYYGWYTPDGGSTNINRQLFVNPYKSNKGAYTIMGIHDETLYNCDGQRISPDLAAKATDLVISGA